MIKVKIIIYIFTHKYSSNKCLIIQIVTVVSYILTNKQYELIELLSQNREVMSSEQISDRIGLSTRTIQRYIELINKYLEKYDLEIISMRGYGYVLQGNIKLIGDLMINLSSNSYDRRIKDITLYLISNEYITY